MSTLNHFDLTGRTALVTGGSRGIGRAIALALAEHGADVAIVYRAAAEQAEEVVDAVTALGRQAWSFQQDLAETDQLAALADRAWEAAGKIDILVNNAGLAYLQPFNEIDCAHWRRVMAVNLDAPFFLAQRVAEHMIAEGIKGRIINVGSKNGFVASSHLAHYNASKGGLEMLARSLAIELGAHGITCNNLDPGDIVTEIMAEEEIDEAFWEYLKEHIPLEGRLGQTDDVAYAAVFMASAAGGYMNGQSLVLDGGVLCQQMPRLSFMPPYRSTLDESAQP